ncbi:hypothetical protein OJAV_G00106770 [Oryzias javanicus]|uniref:Uncharacterized protein n=1 Tax=Oryzias javanicus TaxID=123683 RepID=A0A3S2UA46_ORYJA|nr:hypothetical protein OJAV_G00106770 [Oryzias javanicus]
MSGARSGRLLSGEGGILSGQNASLSDPRLCGCKKPAASCRKLQFVRVQHLPTEKFPACPQRTAQIEAGERIQDMKPFHFLCGLRATAPVAPMNLPGDRTPLRTGQEDLLHGALVSGETSWWRPGPRALTCLQPQVDFLLVFWRNEVF